VDLIKVFLDVERDVYNEDTGEEEPSEVEDWKTFHKFLIEKVTFEAFAKAIGLEMEGENMQLVG
jgi:hypothetical protein